MYTPTPRAHGFASRYRCFEVGDPYFKVKPVFQRFQPSHLRQQQRPV